MAVFYDRAYDSSQSREKVETEMVAFRRENTYQTEAWLVETAVKAEVSFLKSIQDLEPLLDFRHKRHFKAKPGENGMSKSMYGPWSRRLNR